MEEEEEEPVKAVPATPPATPVVEPTEIEASEPTPTSEDPPSEVTVEAVPSAPSSAKATPSQSIDEPLPVSTPATAEVAAAEAPIEEVNDSGGTRSTFRLFFLSGHVVLWFELVDGRPFSLLYLAVFEKKRLSGSLVVLSFKIAR